MNKLIIVIMGDNCAKYLDMCFKSVINADKIIFCWGKEDLATKEKYLEWKNKYPDKFERRENQFDQEDKQMNGKQRNFYLSYLKNHHPEDWCLALDADEVVEDLEQIKRFIQLANPGIYSIRMRHLIQDLAHEDAITPIHFVLNRLFKIDQTESYPEVEHPVLQGNVIGRTDITTIWHLAYCPNIWDIKKRYDNQIKKSNIHSPEYLKKWYLAHLFGEYPRKLFDPSELPKEILDEFNINKDELYFAKRQIEQKHWLDILQWKEYFQTDEICLVGDGLGVRTLPAKAMGLMVLGTDISQFAVDNCYPYIKKEYIQDDLINTKINKKFRLVVAYDILEHIDYSFIDKAINNLIKLSSEYILISVPVIGDPNLLNDSTHRIKENKDWWIKQFTDKGLKYIETPNHFQFKDQIFILKK